MATKIISGFPAIGKSYTAKNAPFMCVDLDSSEFNWIIQKDGSRIPNPDFPQNYVDQIKFRMKHDFLDYIFVSSHENVRHCLKDNKIDFTIVVPALNCKREYYKRLEERGSPLTLIQLVMDNWNDWLIERQTESNCVVLNQGQFLIDILK